MHYYKKIGKGYAERFGPNGTFSQQHGLVDFGIQGWSIFNEPDLTSEIYCNPVCTIFVISFIILKMNCNTLSSVDANGNQMVHENGNLMWDCIECDIDAYYWSLLGFAQGVRSVTPDAYIVNGINLLFLFLNEETSRSNN